MATFKDFYNEELKKEQDLDFCNEKIEGLDSFYTQANKMSVEFSKLNKSLSKADLLSNDKEKIKKLINLEKKLYNAWIDFVQKVNNL